VHWEQLVKNKQNTTRNDVGQVVKYNASAKTHKMYTDIKITNQS